jgi:phosphoglycerol transferase MdoB-like AlkP superfamily enzyme
MYTTARSINKALKYLDCLLLLNAGGLLLELALIDHYENTKQIIPILSLFGVFILSVISFTKFQQSFSQIFRVWMVLTGLVGLLGFVFHAYGNYEFAIEIYPNSSTGQLIEKTIKGATPLLAPGAMIGLGLLGIIRLYITKLYE